MKIACAALSASLCRRACTALSTDHRQVLTLQVSGVATGQLWIGWISRKDRVGKTGGSLHLEATTISNYYVEGEYKSQIRRNTKKSEYLQNCNLFTIENTKHIITKYNADKHKRRINQSIIAMGKKNRYFYGLLWKSPWLFKINLAITMIRSPYFRPQTFNESETCAPSLPWNTKSTISTITSI